jgi:ribosomal protein S18 acetylase RimI-like enzyme
MGIVEETEEALIAQWSLVGSPPTGRLCERDGVRWYETDIRHLPYNGVVRTRLPDDQRADAAIASVLGGFRARGVDCLWFACPSDTPADLGRRLEAHGVHRAERMTYMSRELADCHAPPSPPGISFAEVTDHDLLDAYTRLTLDYWEITPDEQPLVEAVQRTLGPGRVPGVRHLAYVDGTPLAKAFLSFAGPPGVAAIYGMSVRPEARGRGLAAALTARLLERARAEGCHRVVLHSSDMAVGLYRRAGFVEHLSTYVYASAPIWTGEH